MPMTPRQPECAEARPGHPDRGSVAVQVGRVQGAADRLGELQLALDDYRRRTEADVRFDRATGEGRR